MVDDSDYREGFVQGFRAIRGVSASVPSVPSQYQMSGHTPFQVGIMRGIEAGKNWKQGELLDKM